MDELLNSALVQNTNNNRPSDFLFRAISPWRTQHVIIVIAKYCCKTLLQNNITKHYYKTLLQNINTKHYYKTLLQNIITKHYYITILQNNITKHYYKTLLQNIITQQNTRLTEAESRLGKEPDLVQGDTIVCSRYT